jgi:hypothetical protein
MMEKADEGLKLELGDDVGNNSMDVTIYKDGSAGFWVCDGMCRGKGFSSSKEDLIRLKKFLEDNEY